MAESLSDAFLAQQYESLRKEIESNVADLRLLERHAVLATAGIWTWLLASDATRVSSSYLSYLPWLPLALALLAAARAYALWRFVQTIGGFILGLESNVLLEKAAVLGWETYLQSGKRRSVFITSAIFWILLVILTLAAACAFGSHA